MDKYEYKVRANEIKELIDQEEYVLAAEIADTIDWRRVKSVMMLCMISDLYKINRRYEDAKDVLLLAYERRPGGRTICYSLCELSIKMEEYVQAIEYYKEYVQAAPSVKDVGRYILQYKLYEAQDVSLEERIAVLERLKQCEYREKWGYELAYLYHRIGLASRCVEECDEMILWFGDGKYVIKAMELKMLHQPLSPEQQKKYDHRFDSLQTYQPPQVAEQEQESEPVDSREATYEPLAEEPQTDYTAGQEEVQAVLGDTQVYPVQNEIQPEELDIHVKTVDVGQYNTINLQAELAAGLEEVLSKESSAFNVEDSITRSIIAPMLEQDTETLDYPELDEVDEEDLGPVVEEMEETEVFFGETGEIGDIQEEQADIVEIILPDESETETSTQEKMVSDVTAEIVMEQLRQESLADIETSEVQQVIHTEPPKAIAHVLSQGADGQISLVMPESEAIEKQITGQMNLEDILAEWERLKKENQEKRKEEVRQHVLQHTGNMFTEFEMAVRDGLLEQLERNKSVEAVEQTMAEASNELNESSEFVEVSEKDFGTDAEEAMEAMPQETAEETDEQTFEQTKESAASEMAADEFVAEAAEFANLETIAEEVITEADEVEELEEISEEIADAQEPEQTTAIEAFDAEASDAETSDAEISVGETSVEEGNKAEETVEGTQEIEREKERVRSLTREERELYGPYIQSRAARRQLAKAIDNVSLAAYTGNIIITGDEGMDTLTLAKNMIREMQLNDHNFSGKVAKVSGQGLNKKDVASTIERLKNGALVIMKASDMNADTVNVLLKTLQQENMGIVVILEDTKRAMDKLLAQYADLEGCFTARVDVEALSNDKLVAFGRQYAREREYSIDEFGVLALHTRIEALQTIDHVVTVVEVKEIVDNAIAHANKKTMEHFFDVLFGKRYDDEDMIILSEKDFV